MVLKFHLVYLILFGKFLIQRLQLLQTLIIIGLSRIVEGFMSLICHLSALDHGVPGDFSALFLHHKYTLLQNKR